MDMGNISYVYYRYYMYYNIYMYILWSLGTRPRLAHALLQEEPHRRAPSYWPEITAEGYPTTGNTWKYNGGLLEIDGGKG